MGREEEGWGEEVACHLGGVPSSQLMEAGGGS